MQLLLFGVVATVAAVGDVLADVVAQMTALAEGGEVLPVVVVAVAIEVRYGEHNLRETVKF